MHKLTYKIITDISEAKIVWETLSPNLTIYDDWKFRFLYNSFFNYSLAFYTAFDGDEAVALIPLQLNSDKNYQEFFGGSYLEENKIYYKNNYNYAIDYLLNLIKSPTKLEWVNEQYNSNFKIIDYKYIKNLTNIHDYHEYIEKNFTGKSKNTIKRQIKKFLVDEISISHDNFNDFEFFVKNNLRKFGEDSTFNFPHRVDFLRILLDNYECHMISIYSNNETKCVGYSLAYKDQYIFLNAGNDGELPNISKYLYLLLINDAINKGKKYFDARASDCGWKEKFGLEPKPQYSLEINI